MSTTQTTQFNHKEATRKHDLRIEQFLPEGAPAPRDLALEKPVLELCNHYEQLTANSFDGYDGQSGYCGVHAPATLTVDLGKACDLGLVQFLLFDPLVDSNHGKDTAERRYHYRVLVAEDFASQQLDKDLWEWKVLFDSAHTGWCRNWQLLHIAGGLRDIRYIRIHCLNGMKNNGFHIVRLRAYASEVADRVDYAAVRHHLQEVLQVPTPTGELCAIDRSRSMNYTQISPERIQIERGDGFPLSKRLADTMNLILLIADKQEKQNKLITEGLQQNADELQDDPYPVKKSDLEGINTTITQKAEAFTNPEKPDEVELTLKDIYQILSSIVDDIAIVDRDPKNTERVVLDPVTSHLRRGFRRDILVTTLDILLALVSLYLLFLH